MASILTSLMGAAYFQIAPGKKPDYLGTCFDGDALPDPRGDTDPIQCYDSRGRFVTVGKTRTAPGKGTTVLTGLQQKAITIAEQYKERDCEFVFYGSQADCAPWGTFNNYVKLYGYEDTFITDNPIANWLARETDAESTSAYNLTLMPSRIDMRNLTMMALTSDSDQDLISVAVRDFRCAGACGDAISPGDDAIFGGTGAVAATPDVQRLQNGSTNPTDVANLPFAVDEDVISMVRFMVDATTERWLAAREAIAGANPEWQYTDDGGATAWVSVVFTIGANNEGAQGPQALFALDHDHIWFVTDTGEIYFSDDGGLTQTLQLSGTSLYAVHFIDSQNGFAVGAADEMYSTTNGGITWTTLTGTGGGGDLLTLHVFTANRLIVGTDDGDIWMSWDAGANWTQQVDFGTGTVPRLHFWSALRGVAIFNTAAPVGTIYQTSDGGYSWVARTTPANLGLTDIEMFSNNGCYVAGNVGAGAVALPLKGFG